MGRELIRRGHRVTLLHVPDMQAKALAAGLEFAALGRTDYPLGALPASVDRLSSLSGRASLQYAVQCACRISELILRDGPDTIRAAGINALLVDQNEPAGASVAEHLGLPFISVCTSLPLNREPLIPPPFVGWSYSDSKAAELRNRLGYAISDFLIAPIQKTLNTQRRKWKLPEVRTPDDTFSTAAQMAQMPKSFDFPRRRINPAFHYLGPWFDDQTSSHVPFPFDRLDGRPLVYGSLGTLQPRDSGYFRIMAEACAGLECQLVLSLGNTAAGNQQSLPGNPLVINYAPQLELLSRAAVTITHGGMNTTQHSLYFGVPAIAIPLAHDQPAIAARLARSGAGIVIPPKKLDSGQLREAVRSLLPEGSPWRDRARLMSEESRKAGGAKAAADLAEELVMMRSK